MAGIQFLVLVAILGCAFAIPPLPPYPGPYNAPMVYRYRWSLVPPRSAYVGLSKDKAEEICKECKPLGSGLGGYFALEDDKTKDPVHYIRCVPHLDTWKIVIKHCCNNSNYGGGSTVWDQETLSCVHNDLVPNPYPCEGFTDQPAVTHKAVPFWPLVWTPHLDTLVEDRDFPVGAVDRVHTGIYTLAGGHVKKGLRYTGVIEVSSIEFDGQIVPTHNTAQDSSSHIEIPFFQNADWGQYSPGFTFAFGFCIDKGSPADAALITNADCNFTASVEIGLLPGNKIQGFIRSKGNTPDTVELDLPPPDGDGCYYAVFSYTRWNNEMYLWVHRGGDVTKIAQGPPRRINQNPLFFGYSCYGYPDSSPRRALKGAMAAVYIWGDKAIVDPGDSYNQCWSSGFCP